jgi:PAS domain S-box-containing protein
MKRRKVDRSHAAELRRQAEERLQLENPLPEEISPAEAKKLIHELRVHQIELEMQNDELRQAQEILEESRSRYSDLYDFAPIGYLTLDELGIIREANLTAARQLAVERSRLIDRQLTHFMVTEDRGAFRRHLNLVLKGRERQTIELRLKRKDGAEFFTLLEIAFYQDTAGRSLCRTAFTDITERRQAEADLRESEARYRSLFQHNHAVMLLIDPATGDLVDANPAACAFYGFSKEDLTARKITDINTLPSKRVFAEMQLAKESKRRQFHFRHRLARGEVRDVEVFSGPIRLQGQDLLYSIIHDITARKQAEKALQRQQEELQIILDSVPAMIFYKDKENRFIRTNKALAEATGLPKEEMDGKSLFDLYPFKAEDYWEDDQEVMRSSNPKRNIVETLETPEGVRWFQTDKIPYRDDQGNVIGVIGFAVDITERKRAEEALQRSHDEMEERVKERTADLWRTVEQLQWEIAERQRAEEAVTQHAALVQDLYNNAPCGYHSLDHEGTFVQINDTELTWLGYARDEVLGRMKLSDIITADSLQVYKKSFPEFKERGWVKDLEYELVRKDGTILPVLLNATALKDEAGHYLMSRSSVFDITKRKQAEEALKESEQKLRYLTSQLLTAQERERKRISLELHDDLGQSLMVLKMQMRAVERNLPPELKDARKGCSVALKSLEGIIDNIRRISQNLRPSMLEDMGLSTALIRLFDEFCKGQKIECSFDIDDIVNSLSQETEIIIYRIFQETLTNIGKHAQATKVETAIKKCGKSIHFSVKDNGTGFDVEHALAGTATARGMGLGSMEERVRMIDGTLQLWSEEGKGTKISFILPININKPNEVAK